MLMESWLLLIALGAVCGVLGQGLRVIVGLYKNDILAVPENFSVVRLVVSLFIGAIAGSLTSLTLTAVGVDGVSIEQLMTIIAAGYAGTDAIEGLVGKFRK